MFLYRPHIHQLDGTITPDLAVDRLLVDGQECPAELSHKVALNWRDVNVVPAVIVFAAGLGSVLTLGFLGTASGEASPRWCLVSRSAWRLDDLRDHAPRLVMDIGWSAGGADEHFSGQPESNRWVDPPPATASCWSETAWWTPAALRVCSVALRDPVIPRVLSHQISVADDSASH